MLTDRDIVVKVLAKGKDPATTKAGELGQGDAKTVTVGADDSIEEALKTMSEHQVRRLPVIDGHDLVGKSPSPTSPGATTRRRSAISWRRSPSSAPGGSRSAAAALVARSPNAALRGARPAPSSLSPPWTLRH